VPRLPCEEVVGMLLSLARTLIPGVLVVRLEHLPFVTLLPGVALGFPDV
jgi:hypothetical protein